MTTATRPLVTQRQRQILRLVSTGKDDKTIAAELCISIANPLVSGSSSTKREFFSGSLGGVGRSCPITESGAPVSVRRAAIRKSDLFE